MFRDKVPPEPKNVHVQLPASKNVTTIPTYPFPQCILHLLDDERLDGDDYLQSANDNFDRDTFWPIVPIRNTLSLDEETDDDMIGKEEEESDRKQEIEEECCMNDLVNCMLEQSKGSHAKKVL